MQLRTHQRVLGLLFLGMTLPSVASACSLCADAASHVTRPGLLDAGSVLFLFFLASAVLMLFGRLSGGEWRLGSKLYWLVGGGAVFGTFIAAITGMTLAAAPPLILASLLRVYRASKLTKLSARELLATLLSALFLIAGPSAFLLGNQRASDIDYLFSALASRHHVTVNKAFNALQSMDEATAVACARLEQVKAGNEAGQDSRPMEWLGLMRLSEGKGLCPQAVLSMQEFCAFPEGAKIDTNLSCAGDAQD